jgi:hypothetical protein
MFQKLAVALAIGGACLLGSAPAWALKSSYRAASKLPPAELWAKVGDFCGVQNFVPAIATCTMSPDKLTRYIKLKSGGPDIVEIQVVRNEAKHYYTFKITDPGPLPFASYISTMHVVKAPGGSAFIWSGTYTAKGMSDAEVKKIVDDLYKAGCESLVSK